MTARICVDSSVVVKWFKAGEEHEREALKLRDETLSSRVTPVISEWTYLEVVRALVKARYNEAKIVQAYSLLREMESLGFIEVAPLSKLLDKAKDLEISLNLYASDAVNLAVAVLYSEDMLTEDRHLLKDEVKNYMRSLGLKVVTLREFFATK
ncbi:MAG: type II toxin-antitoxin system VapC family toxin [Candidatus Jordarchaeales archaeon]